MTEEEYFRKNYPDSCYGDKPLSPHFDFFQDGVEFGERECEKKIQELEAKYYSVSEIAHHRGMCCISALRENRELEKENAELKKACDETRELLDKQIEATYKLDKENAVLKAKNKWYSEQICNKECKEVWGQVEELQKENAELKEQNRSYEQLIDKGSVTLAQERLKNYKQFTKAKDIIKKFSEFVNNEIEYDPEHPQEHTDLWNELCVQAEQFLKDSEGK